MKIVKISGSIAILFFLVVLCFNACRPVRNLTNPPAAWQGDSNFQSFVPDINKGKKNVFIVADAATTVLFDMLAPFYLFNATENANVYIVAKDKTPVLIKRDLFVVPHLTFAEADAMRLPADIIVVPALSKRDENQDSTIVSWIRNHFTGHTRLLAICDGASTAAATGLYDGKPLTCHASDYANLKVHFSKPCWVQDVAVTQNGNLYSTAGVSNAVEGSLTVIDALFGRETMQKVLTRIAYPAAEIKTAHASVALSGSNKFDVVRKLLFRKNRKIGLLLENGIDEFDMAGIIETYGRSLPASFSAFSLNGSTVRTKYGLTLVTTGDAGKIALDELHLLMPASFSAANALRFRNVDIVKYDMLQKQYLIDLCLKRIAGQYGQRFEHFVKISLDYN